MSNLQLGTKVNPDKFSSKGAKFSSTLLDRSMRMLARPHKRSRYQKAGHIPSIFHQAGIWIKSAYLPILNKEVRKKVGIFSICALNSEYLVRNPVQTASQSNKRLKAKH